ncbi:hypothetical protein THASP1DRAFT_29639 [Thamnocephalis sphaerospora]|uniref:Protein YAE1 n=1 Tax=Thamnocephalis sphaerospora TaxID=78915 RepID=A0A4P9XR84_9FUNG|nr:hypothetical protein THASP1DRAFT_29639 [Thamnocephalis sphaerospora]|eukprot:RKP08568.1 hypothetical protein THASP1DRAFT_29639 [Thamnocephalis sphaerospora]
MESSSSDDDHVGFMDAGLDGTDDNDDTAGGAMPYEHAMAHRAWARMEAAHANEGYREGLEAGKERTLQRGFDQGYREGLALGRQLGRMRGQLASALVARTLPGDLLPALDGAAEEIQAQATQLELDLRGPALVARSDMIAWLTMRTVEQLQGQDAPYDDDDDDDDDDAVAKTVAETDGCCGGAGRTGGCCQGRDADQDTRSATCGRSPLDNGATLDKHDPIEALERRMAPLTAAGFLV